MFNQLLSLIDGIPYPQNVKVHLILLILRVRMFEFLDF